MRFAGVINARAGAASRTGIAALRALMQDSLGERLVSLRVVKPSALKAALEEAVALKPDAALILGGDGTARSAAALLYPTRIPAAFLPGGTMNILPKRLYGEMPLADVLAGLAKDDIVLTELETGLANDEPFFVAASFGFLPLLAMAREQQRQAGGLAAAFRVTGRVLRFGPRLFRPHLRFELAGQPARRSAALIVSLGSADNLHPLREPDTPLDSFECVSLDVQSWSALAAVLASALVLPDWREDPRVEPFLSTALTVRGQGRIRATLDGEPIMLNAPATLRVAKTGLRAVALPAAPKD